MIRAKYEKAIIFTCGQDGQKSKQQVNKRYWSYLKNNHWRWIIYFGWHWTKQGIKTSQSGLILGIINFTEMGGEKKPKKWRLHLILETQLSNLILILNK